MLHDGVYNAPGMKPITLTTLIDLAKQLPNPATYQWKSVNIGEYRFHKASTGGWQINNPVVVDEVARTGVEAVPPPTQMTTEDVPPQGDQVDTSLPPTDDAQKPTEVPGPPDDAPSETPPTGHRTPRKGREKV